MKTIVLILALASVLMGCSNLRPPVQICPEACKPVVDIRKDSKHGPVTDEWLAYSDRLSKQNIFYWLTDTKGRPVTIYQYKHDRGLLESAYWPVITTKEKPKPVRQPFTLDRRTSDVIVHLNRPDGEETISLREATLEHHKDFDVLYVK